MRRALATLAAVAVAAVLGAAPAVAQPAAGAPASASVLGGRTASIAEFPWLAFILARPGKGKPFACTGTVVSPRVVLTAGHCIEQEKRLAANPPSSYRVLTGLTDLGKTSRANISAVSRAIFYPTFETAKVQVDAGLLVLSAPVSAPPVRLATAAAASKAGTRIAIAGWGLTEPKAKLSPASLRAGGLTLKAPGLCKRATRRLDPFYSTEAQLCGLDPKEKTGACFGDSGGPAIAAGADGGPVEVGIVVAGAPKCDPKLPNIYTEVSGISAWVAGWVAKVERGAHAPPVPQASPPRLTLKRAGALSAVTLGRRFGERFQTGTGKRTACRRLGWARARCAVRWSHRGRRYDGAVTIAYVVEGYAVSAEAEATIRIS